MIEYEKIINSLENRNRELELKIKLLENIVDGMNDYISDNNLKHSRFITNDNENINIEDYKNIKSIEIPETRYLVFVNGDDE